jgi:hypothetical protein
MPASQRDTDLVLLLLANERVCGVCMQTVVGPGLDDHCDACFDLCGNIVKKNKSLCMHRGLGRR